jgi:hypothetical protein
MKLRGSRSREGNTLRLSSCAARYHPAGKDRLLRAWGTPLEGNGSISADRTGPCRKLAKIIRGVRECASVPELALQSRFHQMVPH